MLTQNKFIIIVIRDKLGSEEVSTGVFSSPQSPEMRKRKVKVMKKKKWNCEDYRNGGKEG